MKPAGIRGSLPAALPITAGVPRATTAGRAADFVTLAKPRLNALVVATAAAAYYLGNGEAGLRFVNTVVGTALVAGGSAALNQLYERRTDALMHRTRRRPLPDGRLQPVEAAVFGCALSIAGVALLALGVSSAAAIVAVATLVSYLAIYTPLKLQTSLSTLIGAVPGALPAMLGWVAASNNGPVGGWILFAIVFVWQMPHFLAIAWMYREDYQRAGFPLLPIVEPDGRSTGRQALLYALALIPVSVAPTLAGIAGWVYFAGAAGLGITLAAIAARFAADRTTARARVLFLASITYLPIIWALMIADKV
jgi:protoheme IX farnesyltransferase